MNALKKEGAATKGRRASHLSLTSLLIAACNE